jgi:hypothetical protein
MRAHPTTASLLGLFVATAIAVPAVADDFYMYPAKGQSQDQQNKDRYDCNNWAMQQSGFDPSRPVGQGSTAPPPPAPTSPTAGRTAARGAAVGAVGGAIGGNAGKGAAIGAASGALLGGMRRRDEAAQQEYAQQQYSQQVNANYAQARGAYDRAMGACLEGRGYTIK